MNERIENFLMNAAATNFSIPPTSNPMAMAAKTVLGWVVVKGRVQGVFYRNWAVDNARLLGLDGWARNCRDGSVEAVFSGDHDKVDEMQFRCRRGPPAVMATALQVFPSDEVPGRGFDRKSTA